MAAGAHELEERAGRGERAVLLSEVIEALPEGLAVFDENATLVHCNAAFRALNPSVADIVAPGLGWDVLLREWVTRGAFDRQVSDRLGGIEARLADGVDPVVPLETEAQNGTIHEFTLRQTATGGFVVVQTDITARRRFEENEREADALLRSVLEACPANIVMSRVGDGRIVYRTPAAIELLGPTRHAPEHFASREERADFVTALLPDGRVDDAKITALRPDGSRFPCLISARLIDYRGEDVMVTSMVDISKEVALRRALAEQREQIFQAEKMSALGELLAGVAHELNNPLSVVVGHALMMREESPDPETLRRIEKISEAAERCSKIVKSFLAMARQQPAQLVPLDMAEVLEMALDAIRNGAEGIGAELRLDVPQMLPAVRGDAHQLAQVILNLVLNADQAIAESGTGGTIVLKLRQEAEELVLTVADDGPGIPEPIRRRIFDPLFTTKPVGSGTGLGLALAHRTVTAHAGIIRVEPTAGPGATFTVRLPVTSGDAENDTAPDDTGEPRSRGRILVVDDEEDVADLIREILEKDGFAVEVARTAEAALESVADGRFTLILTDLNMPGLGGRGFYERLLRDRPDLGARVGFVTGDTMSPQARGFLDGAGRPFLEKPIAPSDLRDLTRAMLALPEGGPR